VLGTLATILKWAILLPILLAIVLLAVANDQSVTVNLNPFDKGDPVLRLVLPLYQIAFVLFVLGVLFGGAIAWSGQRRQRRRLRQDQAALWQARAEWSDQQQRRRAARPSEAAGFLPRPERG
jgi:hypothetical protein